MPRRSAVESVKMLRELKIWATTTKQNSRTATGKGIARLVEKIAEDGRVTKEDENIILYTIEAQRGWWSSLIVMDTLILAIFAALMIYEQPPDSTEHFSEETRTILLFAYNTCIAFTFFGALVQLFVILLLFALTSYTFEVKAIIFFFVQCHSLLVTLNSGGMLFILPGMTISPVLGQILNVGLLHAIPSIVMSAVAIILVVYVYVQHIEPVFMALYNQEYGVEFSAQQLVHTEEYDAFDLPLEEDDSDGSPVVGDA